MKNKLKFVYKTFSKNLVKVFKTSYNYFYLQYHPDSFSNFSNYEEFKMLSKKWVFNNKKNNKGDFSRLWFFILNISKILKDSVPGDIAEVGVYKANSAYILSHYSQKYNRNVFLFDTYEGFDQKDLVNIDKKKKIEFQDNSIEYVQEFLKEFNCISYEKGYFPDTFKKKHKRKYSILSFDVDLYLPIKNCLEYFYPNLSKGGIMFLHDYSSMHWDGAKKAIDEFCLKNEISLTLMSDKSGTAVIRK